LRSDFTNFELDFVGKEGYSFVKEEERSGRGGDNGKKKRKRSDDEEEDLEEEEDEFYEEEEEEENVETKDQEEWEKSFPEKDQGERDQDEEDDLNEVRKEVGTRRRSITSRRRPRKEVVVKRSHKKKKRVDNGESEVKRSHKKRKREDSDSNVKGQPKKKRGRPRGRPLKGIVVMILRKKKRELTARQISEIALKEGSLNKSGKTPQNTVAAMIYTDMKKNGKDSPFVKVRPMTFCLREFYSEDMSEQ